jgi:hypothetical protein
MRKKLFTKNECDEIILFSENQNRWKEINNGAVYSIVFFKPNEFMWHDSLMFETRKDLI